MEEIDAAIFSGDDFNSLDAIKDFRAKMERWERGLKEIEKSLGKCVWCDGKGQRWVTQFDSYVPVDAKLETCSWCDGKGFRPPL